MSSPNGRAAAIPASISTAAPAAGPALRVYRDDSAAADGGPATSVYLVTAGELLTIGDQGNVPVPIAVVSDGRPVAGSAAPVPVYVVNSAGPTPPVPSLIEAVTTSAPVYAWTFADAAPATEAAPLAGALNFPMSGTNVLGSGPAPFGGITQASAGAGSPLNGLSGLSLDVGSIVAVARITQAWGDNGGLVVSLRDTNVGTNRSEIYVDSFSGTLVLDCNGRSAAALYGALDAWHLVVATWQAAGQIAISVDNGAPVTAAAEAVTGLTPERVTVADFMDVGAALGLTALYDRVLSAEEIADLYAAFAAELEG